MVSKKHAANTEFRVLKLEYGLDLFPKSNKLEGGNLLIQRWKRKFACG